MRKELTLWLNYQFETIIPELTKQKLVGEHVTLKPDNDYRGTKAITGVAYTVNSVDGTDGSITLSGIPGRFKSSNFYTYGSYVPSGEIAENDFVYDVLGNVYRVDSLNTDSPIMRLFFKNSSIVSPEPRYIYDSIFPYKFLCKAINPKCRYTVKKTALLELMGMIQIDTNIYTHPLFLASSASYIFINGKHKVVTSKLVKNCGYLVCDKDFIRLHCDIGFDVHERVSEISQGSTIMCKISDKYASGKTTVKNKYLVKNTFSCGGKTFVIINDDNNLEITCDMKNFKLVTQND